MKALDIGVGILAGAAGYYGLSLASAFWVGQTGQGDHLWSMVLGVAACVGLGIATGWCVGASLVASVLMLILVAIGHVTGSTAYEWAAPFPADFVTLLFHGARSPLVVGPAALVGAAGVWRSVMNKRRDGSEVQSRALR